MGLATRVPFLFSGIIRGNGESPVPQADEPQETRPKRSAKNVQALRGEVKAKDKFAAAAKPEAEAVRFIADEYKTDDDSALAFVQWLKGPASGADPVTNRPAKGI